MTVAAAWPGRRWTLALLLACLAMIGPFAIDTYLPAFGAIATDLQAGPLPMQQTLSVYLLAFAVMNLFHGAIADSVGRRPVVLVGIAVFALASVGCALAGDIGTLVLFHHDQSHADSAMDQIAADADAARPGTLVGQDGMVLRC